MYGMFFSFSLVNAIYFMWNKLRSKPSSLSDCKNEKKDHQNGRRLGLETLEIRPGQSSKELLSFFVAYICTCTCYISISLETRQDHLSFLGDNKKKIVFPVVETERNVQAQHSWWQCDENLSEETFLTRSIEIVPRGGPFFWFDVDEL